MALLSYGIGGLDRQIRWRKRVSVRGTPGGQASQPFPPRRTSHEPSLQTDVNPGCLVTHHTNPHTFPHTELHTSLHSSDRGQASASRLTPDTPPFTPDRGQASASRLTPDTPHFHTANLTDATACVCARASVCVSPTVCQCPGLSLSRLTASRTLRHREHLSHCVVALLQRVSSLQTSHRPHLPDLVQTSRHPISHDEVHTMNFTPVLTPDVTQRYTHQKFTPEVTAKSWVHTLHPNLTPDVTANIRRTSHTALRTPKFAPDRTPNLTPAYHTHTHARTHARTHTHTHTHTHTPDVSHPSHRPTLTANRPRA